MINWRSGAEYDIPWARYPFVKIFIPFALGILVQDVSQTPYWFLVAVLSVLSVVLLIFHRLSGDQFRYVYWFGLITILFWFCGGQLWMELNDERKLQRHFSKIKSDQTELIVKLKYIDEKERYWDCYAQVHQYINRDHIQPANGNLLIRVSKNGSYIPHPRDILQSIFRIREPNPAQAPDEFNWALMLHRRNIHYYTYFDTTQYRLIYKAHSNLLEKTRDQLDAIIHDLVPSERDYPVASAMLLGLRKKMDPELYQAYSGTGAVHILAVSGLHVGIIAHIFQLLFGFISYKGRKLKGLQVVLILTVIWIYTLLTGAAPSILRSALMFSLLHFSRLMQRDAPPLNVLAAAAFILLCIHPSDIYNLGFQLSFAAMAGIFILYEPIRSFITTGHSWVQALWKVIAVSMAAQLVIYPVIGYHFHQFAFYFWLTGLLSTPFSYLVLISGIITMCLYPLLDEYLQWLGWPLQYSVKWMNDSVAWIYSLPLGRIQGWWPTTLDVIILLSISLLLGYASFQKTRLASLAFLSLSIVFFVILIVEEKWDQNKVEIVAGGEGSRKFVWIKDKSNTIFYNLNEDTMKLPFNYLERYNLSTDKVIQFNPDLSRYNSGSLKLSGLKIQYKEKVYQLILNEHDSILNMEGISGLIVLDNKWNTHLSAIPNTEIFTSVNYDIPMDSPNVAGYWHRSSTPYLIIPLR